MSSHQIQLTVNFKEAMILLVGIDETEWWLNALVVVFIYSSEKVGFFSKADPHFLRQSLSKPIFSHSPSEISRLVAIITGKAVETTKRRQLSTFSAHLLTRHFLQ